mmetsp:Transcript_24106/g.56747  ORF Transcript_24106/g.56747 Transcript_24106/m.56747 type:complete len:516 (+) Transcript_24106:135-1682(+)
MPPADSQTPAVELNESEKKVWREKLAWEKRLDDQREHQMSREGLFHDDARLRGLSDDDRMWEIIKMSFLQVASVLESIGLLHYFEYFLQRGILGAKHMRLLTLQYVQTKMPRIADPDDQEAIVDAAATCMQSEDMRFFEARYGDVDRLVLDCQHARRFLSEKTIHEQWLLDQYDLTSPLHEDTSSFHTKWHVPAPDLELWEELNTHADWVAATGCDGFLFLWPVLPGNRVPPVVRCKQVHSMPCTDFAVDWRKMQFVTCGVDGKIAVYNVQEDPKKEHPDSFKDRTAEQGFLCIDAALEDGKAAVGTNFGAIKIVDLQRQAFVSSLPGHQDHCKGLRVDWEENVAVSCSWDSFVHWYDLRSAKLTHKFVGHNANCNAIDVDFHHWMVASAANEYRFILWDLRKCCQFAMCETPGHNPNCLAMDWASKRLATGSDDGLVKIWSLDGKPTWESSIDCKHEMTVAVDADFGKKRIVTASWDYNVDLWDLETGELLHHFLKPRRCMTQVRMKLSHPTGG